MFTPSHLRNSIRENVILAPFTTWKVGGAARYFAEPDEKELPTLVKWASDSEIPIYFLGRGSNVLVSDKGISGLVILTKNSLQSLERKDNQIIAGAGVSLPRLSKFAAKEGFTGYEFMVGIPGTVGGGIAMNAGLTAFHPKEIKSLVNSLDVVDLQGEETTVTMQDLNASYRYTDIQKGHLFVLRARFTLEEKDDPEIIHHLTIEHLRERKSKQPLDKPTAGSTFKSPPGKGAGWYIEQAGLKGLQIGGARISPKHANWIENINSATSDDIRRLIDHVRHEVQIKLEIDLEPEVMFFS